jgi:hypothetical protein
MSAATETLEGNEGVLVMKVALPCIASRLY